MIFSGELQSKKRQKTKGLQTRLSNKRWDGLTNGQKATTIERKRWVMALFLTSLLILNWLISPFGSLLVFASFPVAWIWILDFLSFTFKKKYTEKWELSHSFGQYSLSFSSKFAFYCVLSEISGSYTAECSLASCWLFLCHSVNTVYIEAFSLKTAACCFWRQL